MSRITRSVRLVLAFGIAVGLAAAAIQRPLRAQVAPPRATNAKNLPPANFDIRSSTSLQGQALQERGLAAPAAGLAARRTASLNALTQLRTQLPGAEATFSAFTGGVDVVRTARGALTPPSGAANGYAVAVDFIQSHTALYGLSSQDVATLRFRGESVSRGSGLRMVRIDQAVNGLPVFQSDSRFLLDRDGRLVRTVGTLMPGAASAAPPAPTISAAAALVSAMQSVGIVVAAGDVTATPQGGAISDKTELRVTGGGPGDQIAGPATSQLVYFPLAPGVLVLAYQQTMFTSGPGDWLTIVDASNGTLLWRKNIRSYASTQEARFSVYVQADGKTPADSPAPHSPTTAVPGAFTQFPEIARTIVNMSAAQDLAASPDGWIPDGGQTTTGNNVDACLDRVGGADANICDVGQLDDNGRPVGNPDAATLNRDFLGNAVRDFNYAPPPQGGNPEAGDTPTGNVGTEDPFRRGAVTQLFYITNWYHDRLFHLGFDEAAGNFQNTNYSGMGLGGDRVRAEAQDASGTNNANFSTPPDGQSGRMQMYRFIGPAIDRDGDLDAEIVIHELTHGLSNRLVGNAGGLVWSVGAGMGEGWSDFYALSLLNNTNADNPDGQYASGAYATYKLGGLQDNYVYGIRRFPYSTDNTVNPLTWADVDDVTTNYSGGIPINPLGFEFGGSFEVHNIGEIWALTLWEIRSRVIADPAGANGDVPTGNQTMLQLVTDALKMTPSNPSFIDARTALLDADCATNACANERWIWEGFADRGLGYDAEAPLGQTGYPSLYGHMGLKDSTAMPRLDIATFTVDDSIGNGSGGADPLEPIYLNVSLKNGWRGASFGVAGATATLSSSTPGVVIPDNTVTYPAIAGGATVAPPPGDRFVVVPPSSACGSIIDLTLQVTSSLGVSSQNFSIRLGLPSGTGTPIEYVFPTALGIPDNSPRGVMTTGVITATDEIADLDLRIDSLTHTFPGDLTIMLRGPNGYGTDFVWLPGVIIGAGDGNNMLNVVIDDAATGDLLIAPDSAAPYTGSWKPAFNSPSWASLGDPDLFPDSVGQLSRFNGQSSAGTWTLLVSDTVLDDSGTLNGWTLIVTPRTYACTAFVDPAPVTTITTAPPAPNGLNGWYVTPPTLSVSATDNIGGAVQETRCTLDPGVPPDAFGDLPAGCAFAAPGAPVATDGSHVLHAASIDTQGNAGIPIPSAFKVDTTPPALTCVLPAPVFSLNQAGGQVLANVTDATSGPAAPQASAAPDTSSAGSRSVLISASDVAGNSGSVSCAYSVLSPPAITIVTPTGAPTFGATSPFIALTGTSSDDGSVTQVTWSNDRGGSGTASGIAAWAAPVIPLQTGANVITVSATDDDGEVATDTLTVNLEAITYYLAEGSTGFFDTEIALANPHASQARASVTFLESDGSTLLEERLLPPMSRTTIRIADIDGLESTPVSTIVSSLDMLPLGVERTMSWVAASYGSSGGEAIGQTRLKWLFAEGAQGFFRTYLMVLNPNAAATTATVTFLPEGGSGPVVRSFPMAPMSRLVVDGASVPEIANSSFGIVVDATEPVVAERAMYFGDGPSLLAGGHVSAGAPDASTSWFFAEGATGSFFDTFLLVGNPGAEPANITLTYLLDNGQTVTANKIVPANARLTVDVESEAPALAAASFATQLTSDAPIVAERAMYWLGDPAPWTESHDSLGVAATGTKWLLAEGRVGGPQAHQTYILLGNPSATTADVTITYLRADGTTTTSHHLVPGTSRLNVLVNTEAPALQNEAFGAKIEVANGVGIVVERSIYWNAGGVVWAGGTNVTATRLP
jgi:subtilisin-like proprotein convertase family protein